jgi:hypothetical protein
MPEKFLIRPNRLRIMKNTLLGILFLTISIPSLAQDEEPAEPKGFQKEKLFVGGNFGLTFGNSYTLINISPQIGYRFNRFLAAGLGINGLYISEKHITSQDKNIVKHRRALSA